MKSFDSTYFVTVQDKSEYSAWILPSNGLVAKKRVLGLLVHSKN